MPGECEDCRQPNTSETLADKIGPDAPSEVQETLTFSGLAGHSPLRSETAEADEFAVVDDRVVAVPRFGTDEERMPGASITVIHGQLVRVPP